MGKNMLVSVIIPVYNVAEYLDDCLHSVVAQTYPILETILIDDGSTDASGAMCDRWAKRDKRITVLHQENLGLSAARNAGLDHATGEYILFVDPDDTVAPTYAESLLAAAIAMEVPCVMCGHALFGRRSNRRISYRQPTRTHYY